MAGFDVFLCHSSKDKVAVKALANGLKALGIRPWLDEWELPPGKPWQPTGGGAGMKQQAMACIGLLALLAGCLSFNGGTYQIAGEKIGPGACRDPGTVEISIKGFQSGPNATLSLQFRNLQDRVIADFFGIGIVGKDGVTKGYHNFTWAAGRTGDGRWVEVGETAIITWKIPDFPAPPWDHLNLGYATSKDSREGGRFVGMTCSLEGDNAPWSFEAKPPVQGGS